MIMKSRVCENWMPASVNTSRRSRPAAWTSAPSSAPGEGSFGVSVVDIVVIDQVQLRTVVAQVPQFLQVLQLLR
jgi:hypothetical protein